MALPASIQRDLDKANALLAPQPAQQVVPPVALTPVAEATRVYETAPQPVATPQSQSENWEHKYKTLQGVHNRHVGDLKGRIGELEDQIQRLSRQQAQQVATPAPDMDPQDAETFGEDLVDMVRRTAENMAGSTIREMQGRVAQLEQQLAGATAVASKTADEVFYERLAQLVPDWETINVDDGFLLWLAEIDPMYGQPRQAALTNAGNQRDVTRVAHVFNTYKGVSPPQPKPPASRQEPQVSPRSSGTGSSQLPQQQGAPGGFITIQAVEAFYRDVQRGLYRGREQDMAQQEAVINAALAENRIVDARQVRSAPM